MLVSHRYRFIYTKTNKTAGTSVEAYFQPFCLPADENHDIEHATPALVSADGIIGYRGPFHYGQTWYNHMPAANIRARVGEETWQAYFKFCVIRNPFDRAVSLFYHFKSSYAKSPGKEIVRNGIKYAMGKRHTVYWPREGSDPEQFRHWILQGGYLLDRDKYAIDGKLVLDHYVRYESLTEDIEAVCQRLDVPFEPARLPAFNAKRRSRGIPLPEYYDSATREAVAQRYAFELDAFGYTFPED